MRRLGLLIFLLGIAEASAQDLARLFDARAGALRFEADRVVAETKRGRIVARGNVTMRRGKAVLRADTLIIDRVAKLARATGNVRLFAGSRVLLVGSLEVDLDSMVTVLGDAEIYVKEGISAQALQALTGKRLLRRAGRSLITVRGKRILKGPGPSFFVENGSLTPCDCGDDPPSWQITASKIAVDPGDGAWLIDPIFRIGDDGVLGLPAMWVPLGDRRTGLLQPQVAYTGLNGWLAQGSFFWTWGRSADATVAVDYLENRGVRPSLEMRYAASANTFGRLAGGWIADTSLGNTHRFNLDGYLRQQIAEGVHASLDLALVSDSHYLASFFYAVKDRSVEYLRSSLGVEVSRGSHHAVAVADYYQDLVGGTGARVDLLSRDSGATVHRLPSVSYEVLPSSLGDTPLLGWLRAGFTHFYRTGDSFADTGADGAFQPATDPTRIYRRLDVGTGLSAPVWLGGLRVTPHLTYRQIVYDAGLPGFPATRGHLLLGADLGFPLARTFGATPGKPAPVGSWRHVIEPLLMYRFVPASLERGDAIASVLPGLDDLDGLVRAHRLYAGIRTRLVQKSGPSSYRVPLEARLTQGFDLAERTTADTRLRARWGTSMIGGKLDLSFDPRRGRVDETLVSFQLRDTRGDSIQFGYNYLRDDRHERFDLEDVESPLYRGALARPSFSGGINEITLSPSVRLPIPLTLSWTLHYSFTLSDIVQSSYGLRYDSPCKCWSLQLQVSQLIGVSLPTVGVFLNLTALGSGNPRLPVF